MITKYGAMLGTQRGNIRVLMADTDRIDFNTVSGAHEYLTILGYNRTGQIYIAGELVWLYN